uniref:uncharacterized protein LOC120335091 n=1 Tax=Styela clava TaxID=7725 RepID=UPI001939DFFD|nr:uncharacterized protein LOC120335091 [Styela clava]
MSFNPTDIVGAGGIDDSRFKPWWEKVIEYNMRGMLVTSLLILYIESVAKPIQCAPKYPSANLTLTSEQAALANEFCHRQRGVFLDIAGIVSLGMTIALYICFSTWLLSSTVTTVLTDMKRLDDSLRNKNIRAIHVDNALATPAVNSENQVPQQQDGVVGNQIPQQQDGVVGNRVQQQQDGAVGNRVQQQQDGVVGNRVQQQQDGAVGNRVQQQQDGAVGNRVQQQQDGVVGNRVQQQQDGAVGNRVQQQQDGAVGNRVQQQQDGAVGNRVQQQQDGAVGNRVQQQQDGAVGNRVQQQQDGVVGNRVQQQQDGAVGNRVQQQQGGVVENQVPQQQGGVVGNRVQQQQDGVVGNRVQQQQDGAVGNRVQQQQGGVVGNQVPQQQGGVVGNRVQQQQDGAVGNRVQQQQGGVVGNRVQQQQDGAVGNRVQQQQGGVVGNQVPQQQGGVVENQVPQQQGGSVGNRNQVGANVLSKQIEKKAQEAITGKDFKLAEKLDLMAEVYESLVMDKLQRPYNPIVGTMCCGPWEKFLKRINPGSKIAACYFVRCCLALVVSLGLVDCVSYFILCYRPYQPNSSHCLLSDDQVVTIGTSLFLCWSDLEVKIFPFVVIYGILSFVAVCMSVAGIWCVVIVPRASTVLFIIQFNKSSYKLCDAILKILQAEEDRRLAETNEEWCCGCC